MGWIEGFEGKLCSEFKSFRFNSKKSD